MVWLKSFWRKLRTWLYVIQLSVFGIRFREEDVSGCQYIKSVRLCVDGDFEVTLKFYRQYAMDLLFVRDNVTTVEYTNYLVKAVFEENAPSVFKVLGCRAVMFHGGTNRFHVEEKEMLRLLTDIYLNFLRVYLDRWKNIDVEFLANETRDG